MWSLQKHQVFFPSGTWQDEYKSFYGEIKRQNLAGKPWKEEKYWGIESSLSIYLNMLEVYNIFFIEV